MVYDPGTTDSIVADSITRAMERVEADRPRHFIPWLYQIAKNKALHFIRSQKIEERVLESRKEHSARSAFAEAISKEALKVFDREVLRLNEAQRKILLFRIIDHLSMEEIGERLKMRPSAVRAVMHRARLKLRRWLHYMRAV